MIIMKHVLIVANLVAFTTFKNVFSGNEAYILYINSI